MWRRNQRTILASVVGLSVVAVMAGMNGVFGGSAAIDVPTTVVSKGEFIDYLQVRGEVKAVRAIPLTVPTTGGGDLQILELATNGMNIKKGDVVVRFDKITVERTLNDRRSDFKQADEEIAKTRAQFRIQEQQAQTDVTKGRYDVRRSELDIVPDELRSKVEREQKLLALADAKARLAEAERKLKALGDIERAEVASKIEKRDKARFDMEHAQRQLGALEIPAPVDGVVAIMPNWRSCCPPPDFKVGDRAWPGQVIAEVPDLSTLRVIARLEEAERGRMQQGQRVVVRADAVPDKELDGKIADISALARVDFSNWPPQRNFNMIVELDQIDARLRPGMNTTVRVAVDRVADAVLIPARAVFEKEGRAVAYVRRTRGGWDERLVDIARRGQEQHIVGAGVAPGERVALKDPIPPGQ
jgi:multidrug resistance efflux pump